MTVNEFHRTVSCYIVGVEDRDGHNEWYKVTSLAPLSSMCQADLYCSLKDTIPLQSDDIITVIDICKLPVYQHQNAFIEINAALNVEAVSTQGTV